MRKTLIAMLGLVALGLWALPALAAIYDPPKDLPKVSTPIELENRAGIWQQQRVGGNNQAGTLSGTLIKQAQATTTWFMYPGACYDRAAGTWAPRTTLQSDSLSLSPVVAGKYDPGTTGPYTAADQSLSEILFHVSDNATCNTSGSGTNLCPPAINGTRMIWCGKFDANWVVKYGYPNLTYQILYIDTGAHTANYALTFKHNFSVESGYDYISLIGGGDNALDPIGSSRAQLDNIISTGASGNQKLLVYWTGSIQVGTTASTTAATVNIYGSATAQPITATSSFTIEAQHRALYFVFTSDCLYSQEDGNWPLGRGQQMDDISTNDNGALYTDEVASGGVDGFSGNVLKGTAGAPVISARVPPGVGTLWQLVAGINLPTADTCTPKNTTTDLIFMGGISQFYTLVNTQFNSILTCSFPVPTGTANVLARWNAYFDLPSQAGFFQDSEYRTFKDGTWGNWLDTNLAPHVNFGSFQSWRTQGDDLATATQADSVQIRYSIRCIIYPSNPAQACQPVLYGILYDNFRLEMVSGVPAPLFGVFVGDVAQTTFVDGTMTGLNCSSTPCWPGVRGTGTGNIEVGAIHDNFNSPYGDSITVALTTGLRKNGKGINWRFGFDKSDITGGRNYLAHTNPNFVAAYGAPQIIYRIFDPATKTWSPFDSSEMDANNAQINAGDTILVEDAFRMNWPPRDKAGTPYPGGFTLNGVTNYPPDPWVNKTARAFLPRGARVQYYWKAVDIAGGRSYQFSTDALAREVEDLPTLPGGSVVAPDIIEFNVLPRVYSPGASGTLLAGRTDTPLLDLDGAYTSWDNQFHATQAYLRALGVRADRFRTLQGHGAGGHVGGHEFAGVRPGRLSNYFPNMNEYGIADSLAKWYRIIIESSHGATEAVDEDSDSRLIKTWWERDTGSDQGDRCIFASGDDYFTGLLAVAGVPHPDQIALSQLVFGVNSNANQWNGGGAVPPNQSPTIKDLFADPLAGPALGSGSFQYVLEGGCPSSNRFDALTKQGTSEARNSATYPTFNSVTDVAAVSQMTERDPGLNDHDRNKALGYGFSIQQTYKPNVQNGVLLGAQVLYKFLTSCRGPRTVADTASCWPCPTDINPGSNWATSSAFNIATYGPLYPIQDATRATVVGVGETANAPAVNRIQGNFPNPFNPETAIRFTSAKAGRVEVRIFDVAGRLVQTLAKNVTQGVNEVRWNGRANDGSNLASGVYFVRVKYPDGVESSGLKVAIVR